MPILPQAKGRNGSGARTRSRPLSYVYIIADHKFHLCYQQQLATHARGMVAQHYLYARGHNPIPPRTKELKITAPAVSLAGLIKITVPAVFPAGLIKITVPAVFPAGPNKY